MRRLVLAALAATVLASPVLAEDAKPAVPPAQVKFATLPDDTVLSYNLKNLTLVDGQNSTVAEIKDLALSNGRLVGYIVSVGGFLGMGERYVAIDPTSVALTYDTDAKKWKASVNANKDQLKAAPEFKYEGKYKN
ncbi:PRC-barrel domain-containing protein [Methylobacterium radiotolerans]|uniref:PRC-barrel domain-containing protein n=1 Tax=Methylobacterium radiotolerans TaxID=31998 RepID=UPI001F40D729|nr:PRC-barrel domain-containing protein [Methylobacterium radiotolerans]UIY43527.1 PRC-barrel domain-containing protein [Methylobacterium radiotolerans]